MGGCGRALELIQKMTSNLNVVVSSGFPWLYFVFLLVDIGFPVSLLSRRASKAKKQIYEIMGIVWSISVFPSSNHSVFVSAQIIHVSLATSGFPRLDFRVLVAYLFFCSSTLDDIQYCFLSARPRASRVAIPSIQIVIALPARPRASWVACLETVTP